ncbi:MAG: flagellar protein FlgN [Gammaproteobacteria bacterium]|nr:flagellar protein FlgN [Gammaproteobacteria bacterium]
MNSPSSQPLNDRIPSLIAYLITCLQDFHSILAQESELLKSGFPERITEIIEKKHTHSERLLTSTQTLQSTLLAENSSIESLLSQEAILAYPPELKAQINTFIELSEKCQDLNLANGMSIRMLTTINQHALDIASGKSTSGVKLYGSSGTTERSNNPQNTLGKA